MDERGISAAELTRGAGITRGLTTQWKQRKQNPSSEAITKIASYFNVSTDYLLGKTDNPYTKDITFDDFIYAMYNEAKDLTAEDKAILLDMAKVLKQRHEERRK